MAPRPLPRSRQQQPLGFACEGLSPGVGAEAREGPPRACEQPPAPPERPGSSSCKTPCFFLIQVDLNTIPMSCTPTIYLHATTTATTEPGGNN
ncbi:Hypothetical predicted protein [Podarcis lilfordi]|uniref:Uncharacterized protein n=1 Tax=Podarcis lilfordi TaxID=74358 RepID=A0AA35P867_9SAUR|nr:Hypothetical predicted protein [Podarcis lilfordi]